MDSGAGKDFNLQHLLCLPFRAAESGNFEAAVKLSLAYLYNEGCKCGSLSWGFGERGMRKFCIALLRHWPQSCHWEFRVRSYPLQTCDETWLLW